jgi:predicted anti-sigma-YlaC factor YlaD
LDGELSAADSAVIDEHLRQCAKCRSELAEQRSLLRTIDLTFRPAENLPLPIDFARLVAARAESDMSGVRDRREHRLAFRLCAGLALAALP